MSIDKAKDNQDLVNDLFDVFINKTLNGLLISEMQKEAIEDAKWSVSGFFDAEICYAENMKKFA